MRGRDFTENDTAEAPAVNLINEAFARQFWPNQDPIGQHIMHGNRMETIIGIVADFHDSGLAQPASPMIIAPIAQVSDDYNAAYANIQPLFWLVRTQRRPTPLHSCDHRTAAHRERWIPGGSHPHHG